GQRGEKNVPQLLQTDAYSLTSRRVRTRACNERGSVTAASSGGGGAWPGWYTGAAERRVRAIARLQHMCRFHKAFSKGEFRFYRVRRCIFMTVFEEVSV